MSHYYCMKGGVAQRYKPLKANGEEYIRIPAGMAAKAGAVLGVTDLQRVIGNTAGLNIYYMNNGIQAGLEIGNALPHYSIAELLQDAKERAKELTEQAANEGTAIHDAIQTWLEGGPLSDNPVHAAAQVGAGRWLSSKDIPQPYACEHNACERALLYRGEIDGQKVGYGGTTDFIAPSLIADWKTVRDSDWGRGRKPKWSEAAQLAAYRIAGHDMGLCKEDSDCFNLYFGRESGELLHVQHWTKRELEHGLWLFVEAVRVGHRIELMDACIGRGMGK